MARSRGTRRPRGRRWFILGISLVILAVIAAVVATRWGSSSADGPPVIGVTRVEMRDGAFNPPAIQVTQGTNVTWSFSDGDTEHNVVGKGWGIETPQSAGTFEHTFLEPGTYFYRCTLHFRMEGRVDVASSQGALSTDTARRRN